MPLSEAEFTLTSILEELQKDPNPVKSDKRPLRATGAALAVAVGLLETTFANAGKNQPLLNLLSWVRMETNQFILCFFRFVS